MASLERRLAEKREQHRALQAMQAKQKAARNAAIVTTLREELAKDRAAIKRTIEAGIDARKAKARQPELEAIMKLRLREEEVARLRTASAARKEREDALRLEARVYAEEMVKAGGGSGTVHLGTDAIKITINEDYSSEED